MKWNAEFTQGIGKRAGSVINNTSESELKTASKVFKGPKGKLA